MSDVANALSTMERAINEMLAKVSGMKKAANYLAASAGLPEPYSDVETEVLSGAIRLRSDQFVTEKAPASAARAYLAVRGKDRGATTVEDIYESLIRGGYDFGKMKEPEAKGSLRIALAKDGKMHRLANGHWGLREWYGIADEEKAESKASAPARVKTAAQKRAVAQASDDQEEDEDDGENAASAAPAKEPPKQTAKPTRRGSTAGGGAS